MALTWVLIAVAVVITAINAFFYLDRKTPAVRRFTQCPYCGWHFTVTVTYDDGGASGQKERELLREHLETVH